MSKANPAMDTLDSNANVIESDSRIIARLSDMVVITSKIAGQNWKVEVFDLDPLVAQVIDCVHYFEFDEAVDLHDCLVRAIDSIARKDFAKIGEIRKDLASCKVPNYGIIRYGGDFFYLEDLGVLLSMLFSYFEGIASRPGWKEHYIKKIERIRETLARDAFERRRLEETMSIILNDPTRFTCACCGAVAYASLSYDPNKNQRECAECGTIGEWVQSPGDAAAREAAEYEA